MKHLHNFREIEGSWAEWLAEGNGSTEDPTNMGSVESVQKTYNVWEFDRDEADDGIAPWRFPVGTPYTGKLFSVSVRLEGTDGFEPAIGTVWASFSEAFAWAAKTAEREIYGS